MIGTTRTCPYLCDFESAPAMAANDPSTVVEIPVPVLIEPAIFERLRAKLDENNPRTTAPRIVNGPSLLTGLAACASCGSGMTRMGTNRRGKSYLLFLWRVPSKG